MENNTNLIMVKRDFFFPFTKRKTKFQCFFPSLTSRMEHGVAINHWFKFGRQCQKSLVQNPHYKDSKNEAESQSEV